MPYYTINDFRNGLDTRRQAYTAPVGSLRQLVNAHVNNGGEIEKRKAWVSIASIPGTIGAYAVGDTVYAVIDGNNPVVPTGVAGQRVNVDFVTISMTSGNAIVALLDWDLFDGKPYLVLEDNAGNVEHFYDGSAVTGPTGRYVATFRDKIYCIEGKNLKFCAVGDPTNWAGTGAGTINPSVYDAESANLLGLEVYYDKLAVMSDRTTQIWDMDADPANNQLVQTLKSTGTIGPLTVRQFGDGDILYLAYSGLRSLRARDSSNNAVSTDTGSPVDKLVLASMAAATTDQIERAVAVIDPTTGSYLMAIDNTVYLLSYYPTSKITAWCQYETPGEVDTLCICGQHVVLRCADTDAIYLLGGQDNDTYDTSEVTVVLPYHDMDRPATEKILEAIDLAAEGTWTVEASLDPRNPAWEVLATVDGFTYTLESLGMTGETTHVALRLTNSAAEMAVLANIAIHYEATESD